MKYAYRILNNYIYIFIVTLSFTLSPPLLANVVKGTLAKITTPSPNSAHFTVALSESDTISLDCKSTDASKEAHGPILLSDQLTYDYTLYGLKGDTFYNCCVEALGSRESQCSRIHTPPLPIALQKPFKISGDPTQMKGYVLTYASSMVQKPKNPIRNPSYAIILDPQGNVRWFLSGNTGIADLDTSYLGQNRILAGGWSLSDKTSFAPTIYDLDGHVLWAGSTETSTPNEAAESFNHDVGLSDSGTSIFTILASSIHADMNGDGTAEEYGGGFVLKEIGLDPNTPLWWWDSQIDGIDHQYLAMPMAGDPTIPSGSSGTSCLPGSGSSPGSIPYCTCNTSPGNTGSGSKTSDDSCNTPNVGDPFHANAIDDQWENGKLYVYASMRNLNQVLKIDYATKQLVWKLGLYGDFKLLHADSSAAGDSEWFFGQHDARVYPDGTVTVYDNGMDSDALSDTIDYSRPYTRALHLKLDEAAKTATILWQYTETNWSDPIYGAVDRLSDGNYLTGSMTKGLRLVDSHGQALWKADYNTVSFIYRARFIPGCDIFANKTYCSSSPQ